MTDPAQKFSSKIFGLPGSADDLHLAGVADDDELSATFDEVKTPAADFCNQRTAPDLAFDVTHRPTDDAAPADRLGRENILEPGVGGDGRRAKHLHARFLRDSGEERVNAVYGKGSGLTPAATEARI